MRTMFVLLISTITLALLSTGLSAEELKTFNWADLKDSEKPRDAEVLSGESSQKGGVLKIENTKSTPETIQLLEIKDPKITDASYVIRGNVRYQDVQGKSYLEMWSHFPDGTQYFSRTILDQGSMRNLEGSSDWRPFTLPFFMGENKARPNRLVVNLVLKGSGTVYLSPLHLEQPVNQQALLAGGVWWNPRIGNLVSAVFGILIGITGGVAGILVSRGRGRRFMMALMLVYILLGIVSAILGLVALFASQPYAIWYPLLLIGILAILILIPARIIVRRRYEEWELRKISATDLGMTPGR